MKLILSFCAATIVTVIFASSASAATFTVNTTNDTQDFAQGNGICFDANKGCSLRAAITEANALPGADTINIPAGTYEQKLLGANEENNAGGDWDITDSVAIVGTGSIYLQAAASAGTATERVLDILNPNAAVSISGLTVRHGRIINGAMRGGGIRSLSDLMLTNVAVKWNTATYGGGGIYHTASLTINSSTLAFNSCVSTPTSSCAGGAVESIFNPGERLTATDTDFDNNSANATNNRRGNGGAVSVQGAGVFHVRITGGRFYSNTGGAIDSSGGGLYVVASNGISTVDADQVRFERQDFNPSGSDLRGLGIALETIGTGSLYGTFSRMKMVSNPFATSDASDNATGGHISAYSRGDGIDLTVYNSSLVGGKAFRGGAIAIENTSGANTSVTLDVGNSSFISNSVHNYSANSPDDGDGGAIYLKSDATRPQSSLTAWFSFCTFYGNYALRGKALFNHPQAAGRLFLQTSIIAEHFGSGTSINGSFNSTGYNHYEEPAGTYPVTTGMDSYGLSRIISGPGNEYMVPSNNSPAKDSVPRGSPWGCGGDITIDQIFQQRPSGSLCDKGAIEVQH